MINSQSDKGPLEEDALGKIISLHLDSKLTDEQFSQLKHTLEIDESARDFYIELITIHSQLEQIHKTPFSNKENLNGLIQVPVTPSKMPYFTMMGLPAALIVVICVWIGSQLPDKPAEKLVKQHVPVAEIVDYHVTVADSYDVKLSNNDRLSIGDHLKADTTYRLTTGQLELLFITGVKASITAPAAFEVTGENEIHLSAGILMAKVTTAKGQGFTVKTPGGPVRDLGTLFGVEIDNSGTSGVQVFEGRVELANSRGETFILPEGKTMQRQAGQDQWLPEKRLSRKFYSVIQQNKLALTPNLVLVPTESLNLFGADEYIGKAYLMYSPTPVTEQVRKKPLKAPRVEIAQNYAVVYFDLATNVWQLLDNEERAPFTPEPTDLILASIESSMNANGKINKKITYLSGTQENIHGIASGYQSGDLQLIPDRFRGEANEGEFTLDGTYFILNQK